MSCSLDVLLPHYRDPAGLKRSLDSIAAQTWGGTMRVVIVDDGSPEADRRAAEAHAGDFARHSGAAVTFLANPQNLGRPRTRNRLLDAIEADYVAWLDAGDIWYPKKLERQFAHLSQLRFRGADIDAIWVTCSYDWQWEGNEAARTLRQDTKGNQVKNLLEGSALRAYLWTLLGSRQAFQMAGRFDERLPRMQDLDYFLRFVRAGGQLHNPPNAEALCCYFKSDVGRDAREIYACNRLIMDKLAPVIQAHPPGFAAKLHYKASRLAARFAANNKKPGLALFYWMKAVSGSPRYSVGLAVSAVKKRLLRA